MDNGMERHRRKVWIVVVRQTKCSMSNECRKPAVGWLV